MNNSQMFEIFMNRTALRVVSACDAMVVCNLLLNHWVPEYGFPIQMIGDLGSSNFNDLVFILQDISGVDGLYASPRRHMSIGAIERIFQELNKQFRLMNISLDGAITDLNEREEAVFHIRQFLPAIESYLNSRVSSKTGLSPNLLDKGRHLRGIGAQSKKKEKKKDKQKDKDKFYQTGK